MAAPLNDGRVVRFGAFELNLSSGELRKSGVKLRLQGQPFQVLATLLERPGVVITREELRQKLWPSDTFVDFDHSLNTAINKVRDVLGDSASAPRYVETVARRGYRFVAPIQSSASTTTAEPTTAITREATTDANAPAAASPSLHPELAIPIPNRGLTRGLFVLIQVMYLVFYTVALLRLHAVQEVADSILSPMIANAVVAAVMITAGVGIPLRCYLISSAAFDYQKLAQSFRRIFPALLILDELWAIAPFLLIQKMGLGGAFAASAALLYIPFSERALIRMAYAGKP